MKIGIDGTSWFNGRGYGRFTRELLPELVDAGEDHEFVLFVEAMNEGRLGWEARNLEVHGVRCSAAPTEAAAASGYRSPRDMLRFTSAVRRRRPDVLFFSTVYTYFPVPRGARAVVTVHDAITERFPELTLPTRRARLFWRLKVWLALRQSRIVLTVSDYAASEITSWLGVPKERLRVTSEAPARAYVFDVSPEQRAGAHELAGLPSGTRWFTYVGGFNPHKRVDVLIRAHARLVAGMEDPPHLLLVGSLDRDVFHGCQEELTRLPGSLGTQDLVHWTGFVPDERLRVLHAVAVACVLPSESEGFGLPAVEAAACGAPVIATTESPLTALLEGGGVFVRPGDEAELAEAMRRLATDGAQQRARGRSAMESARSLSWAAAARRALDAIEEAAA